MTSRGAHVGLVARSTDGLEAARREVEASGGRARVLPCDVSEAEAVERVECPVGLGKRLEQSW